MRIALGCLFVLASVGAFQTVKLPARHNKLQKFNKKPFDHAIRPTSTSLNFMGSDGGLLGVGTPELFTILLVGYFVLGPSDLYKLTKEIGKFITNVRTLGNDLTKTFENNMENQLQLEDLRKAQRELNDAFSFRRTINVDEESEAFSTTVDSPREKSVQDLVEEKEKSGKKKKIRVRKRKVESSVPDLEMPTDSAEIASSTAEAASSSSMTQEEIDEINREFNQYTNLDDDDDDTEESDSWFKDGTADVPETSTVSSTSTPRFPASYNPTSSANSAEANRFQQQLSGNWNEQVLANEDKLSPLSKVMEMLAVLEEEKVSAKKRLEEEFERRKELDENYYQKQRKILEEAAAQVQADAYASSDN